MLMRDLVLLTSSSEEDLDDLSEDRCLRAVNYMTCSNKLARIEELSLESESPKVVPVDFSKIQKVKTPKVCAINLKGKENRMSPKLLQPVL